MKGASTIFLQYFPLNMSIVWNNSLGEIGAKRSEYEKAAPSQYLHLGSSADEEMRDGAVGKFGNVKDLTRILVSRPGFSTEISFRHPVGNICLINIYGNLYSFFILTSQIRLAPISPKLLFKTINIFSSKYCNKIVLAPFIFLIA